MRFEYSKVIEKVNQSWIPFFDENKEELEKIFEKINKKKEEIYPLPEDLFRALFYFPPNEIKLVIIGQDPYIGSEDNIPQAMGLSFSVPKKHRKIPPSLQNIFKEIKNCYPDFNIPNHGLLKRWAKQEKILLLNSALTVKAGESNSHANLWVNFTDKLIKYLSDKNDKCVFLLMGNFAKGKKHLINEEKHKVFITVHPSPLSASRGFFGCGVFKEINEFLLNDKINW